MAEAAAPRTPASPAKQQRLPVVGEAPGPKRPGGGGGGGAGRGAAPEGPWLRAARVVTMLGFLAAVPVILGVDSGMRLFWTVTIAVLPLLFVLGGFHLWRRICPLAAVAQLGRLVGRPGRRKVGPWLAKHYLLVQLGVLFVGLAARLVCTNGTPVALAIFLGVVVVAAATTSFVYGGKVWCNYLCPVGVVEKIYTEPAGAVQPPAATSAAASSACTPCTACKKNCPDIDLEQGYWKEAGEPARRWVYFAWPGIVLAFYGYYHLCSGGWGYYFSGDWTREPEQWRLALDAGFHFAPWVPRLVAAPLTLAAGGLASLALFALVERTLRHRLAAERARHVTLVVAGLAAFLGFYLFAGQPTLAQAPWWLRRAIEAVVVGAGVAMLLRRLPRTEAAFVNDKAARTLLRKWEWDDAAPASGSDALVVHAERQRAQAARLRAYKETLRELVADGVVARGELTLLDSLRKRLELSDKEHAKVVSELSAEEKQLFDPAYRGSVEQRRQRDQYRRDLERLLVYAAREGVAPDAEALEALREDFGVPRAEHEAALGELRSARGPLGERAQAEVDAMVTLARAARRARAVGKGAGSHSVALLGALVAWRQGQRRALHAALAALVDGAAALPDGEPPADDAADAAALLAVAGDDSPYLRATAAWLLSRQDDEPARAAVRAAASDEDALVREAAVRALGARGRLTHDLVQRALDDKDARVKRAVLRAVAPGGGDGGGGGERDAASLAQTTHGVGAAAPGQFATLDKRAAMDHLSTLEKIMFLHEVPLLAALPPDDLEEIATLAGDRVFTAGQTLCRQGERGDEVFVIVAGRVSASVVRAGEGAGAAAVPRVLGESGAGQCLGEMAALDAGPRTATLTALADTRTLVLDGRAFRELLAERPALATSVLSVVTARLRAMIADQAAGQAADAKETP